MCHLLGTVARPDVEWFSGALRLLQRDSFWQLRAQNEWAEHVAEFLNTELVLKRRRTGTVDDDAKRLETGAETTTNFFDSA